MEMALLAASGNKQTDASGGTLEDSTKHSVFDGLLEHLRCPFTSIVFRLFQLGVMSATSSSSHDCTVHHNKAVEQSV